MQTRKKVSLGAAVQPYGAVEGGKIISRLQSLAVLLVICSLQALSGCGGGGGGGQETSPPPAPGISSLSPNSGAVGATVTITGSNFGSSQGTSTVTFNGTSAGTASAWSATSITVTVPSGAATGNVVVTVGGQASNGVSFTVTVPAPSITSLSPTSGPVGTAVTIAGTNFGSSQGSSTVTFNGTSAGTASAWSATSITVTVPSGAATGNVVVTVGGQASNGVSFTVTVPAPSITSLSPTSGPVGTAVTIAGSNFGSSQGSSMVMFNGASGGTASAWSATSITVTVPSGATTGNVVVTVGGQASNGVTFTVGASSANTVTGTAALGAPIADAAVTLVDANGNASAGTTASDGTFILNSGGLTPPFLVRVVTAASSSAFPAGTTLYSVSADGNATTHINVHVLSDLIVRSWYGVQGLDVDSAFANPTASNAPPNPSEVVIVANSAIQAFQLWFSKAGITATAGTPSNGSVNLISSRFTANSTGLDSVLHGIASETLSSNTGTVTQITVTGGTVTETISAVYSGGSLTLNTTTTDSSSGAGTNGSASTVVPTSSAQQAVVNGINSSLTTFQNTVNAKGSVLAGSDLLPFYTADYVNDGDNAATDAAGLAASLAGSTINSLQIVEIKSLDTTQNTADIIILNTFSEGSQTATAESENIFKNEGNGWLLYGDQRIAQVRATAQSRSSQGSPSLGANVSHGTYIFAGVEAPQGVVTKATVSGGGNIWNGTASGTLVQFPAILQNGQTLDDFLLLSQPLGIDAIQLPVPGTPFTFNLTTASSGTPQYVVPSNAFTTEFIQFSGISSSGPLSSVLGKTLTYNWSLPTTFAISAVYLSANVEDGSGPTADSCSISAGQLAVTATSGTLAIPANMSACGLSASDQIQGINVFLEITGTNDEDALDELSYPYSAAPAAPAIGNVSPTSGAVGTEVTITGSNFGASQGSSTVTFNGTSAGTASAWSATSITVTAPSGATTGNVVVSVGGQASNGAPFTVVASSPDFSVSVVPSSVSTQAGTTSAPVTVSVNGLNGFSGTVSISVAALSSGIACSPSCPISISANSSAQLSFVVPANASTNNLALTVQGTSGTLSHSAPLTLDVTSSLQAYWNLWNGSTESVPQGNPAPASGLIFVSGWAFEKVPLNAVTVLVDNVAIGNAFYGTPRPDIDTAIKGAPEDCGFSLSLDTTKLSNGLHTVSVNVTDSANNVTPVLNYPSLIAALQINVNNSAPTATGPVAKLTINAPTTSLVAGTIVGFTASATNGSGQAVSPSFTWSSSNATIVKVTPAGAVLPLTAGTATISVSAGGMTQQVGVTVQAGSGTPGTIQVTLGPDEIVYQYLRDACMEGDVPDGPARSTRLSDGSILLIAGDAPFNFADAGADFWSLQRRCSPLLVSPDNPTASSFANLQWIDSIYNDGTTIHALVHNEFHDPVAPTCKPGDSTDGNPCQYTSITYAISTDGGQSFSMAGAPQNVVSAPPVQWTPPPQGTSPYYYGYQEPTNIVHDADGYYYARFGEFPPPGQPYYGGNCVMRTQTLSDPTSWRAWDGTAFELQMTDPYTATPASLCAPTTTTVPWESLTHNTYLGMYMLVGLDSDYSGGTPINCGFHFSLSSDLVNWSTQQFIAAAYVPAPNACEAPAAGGVAGSFAYASIIDPDDSSTNFESPGRTAYIYYTRFNDNTENRDLVRVPVLFTKY